MRIIALQYLLFVWHHKVLYSLVWERPDKYCRQIHWQVHWKESWMSKRMDSVTFNSLKRRDEEGKSHPNSVAQMIEWNFLENWYETHIWWKRKPLINYKIVSTPSFLSFASLVNPSYYTCSFLIYCHVVRMYYQFTKF